MRQTCKPLILAFGHKAQQGKDEAAKTILRERGSKYKIAVISFADALRKEVNDTCEQIMRTGMAHTYQDALAIMCLGWEVEFDENAPVDAVYPHGKQRRLLQAIGQGRREQDPDYWVKRWEEAVEASDADIIIVTDMRYPNELFKVKFLGGVSAKFTRIGHIGLSLEAAAHISENALNDATFDHDVIIPDGNVEMLRFKSLELFDFIMHKNKYGW